MKRLPLLLIASLVLAWGVNAHAQVSTISLSGATIYSADSSGMPIFYGGTEQWGGSSYALFLTSGGTSGPFLLPGSGAGGGIPGGTATDPGVYTFGFYADSIPGTQGQSFYGITLSFNQGAKGGNFISSYVPIGGGCANDCIPINSIIGTPMPGGGVTGASGTSGVVTTLSEQYTVSLLSFSILSGGTDLVGQQTIGSDGYPDYVGTVSFSITNAVPEPETYAMMLAGLGFICVAVRRKTLQ
jgi:hypothetical protein